MALWLDAPTSQTITERKLWKLDSNRSSRGREPKANATHSSRSAEFETGSYLFLPISNLLHNRECLLHNRLSACSTGPSNHESVSVSREKAVQRTAIPDPASGIGARTAAIATIAGLDDSSAAGPSEIRTVYGRLARHRLKAMLRSPAGRITGNINLRDSPIR